MTKGAGMNGKAIAVIVIFTLATGGAWAQDNALGLYFNESEYTLDTAHRLVAPGFAMPGYIVLTNPTLTMVTGYEVGIACTAPDFAIPMTNLTFDTNLGTNTNQIVTFMTPKPAAPSGTVLATVFLTTDSTDYEEIAFGPSDPSSLPGSMPVIYDGAGGFVPASAPFEASAVAWLNGTPVPVQRVSWEKVRALFR